MLTDNEIAGVFMRMLSAPVKQEDISALLLDYMQLRQDYRSTTNELAQTDKYGRDLRIALEQVLGDVQLAQRIMSGQQEAWVEATRHALDSARVTAYEALGQGEVQ